jgi:ABC-type multidrug transport system ATPase subunit
MKIRLSDAGKRFNRDWIFRKAGLEFDAPTAYAITGPNGSGKSTLLQCIGGMVQLSEGRIAYEQNGKAVSDDAVFREISFCAPYLDVIEEFSLTEFLDFHHQFKAFYPGFNTKSVIEAIGLQAARNKQIRFYSSGMKQRVKLAQALLFHTGIVLLDEPCSNLDAKGIELYHSLVRTYAKDRLVIVCSNDEVEYSFCEQVVSILDYK